MSKTNEEYNIFEGRTLTKIKQHVKRIPLKEKKIKLVKFWTNWIDKIPIKKKKAQINTVLNKLVK